MKKLVALFLTLIICATSLFSLVAYAQEDVIFEGNFDALTLVVGQGQMSDVMNGITAKDAQTNEDLTSKLYIDKELDFSKEGTYIIMYKIEGKTSFKDRTIKIEKSRNFNYKK